MSALVQTSLSLDTYCDFAASFTLLSPNSQIAGLVGCTAQMAIRATPTDPTLVVVTTTSSSSGLLSFGVAPPAPVGGACTNLAELLALGSPLSLQTTPPAPISATFATTAAMAAADTTNLTLGTIDFVTAGPGSYFMWSPGDPNTPNGTTIIARTGTGPAGNWLLCGTVNATIAAAAMVNLLGVEQAYFDLLVTFGSGGNVTAKLLEGPVFVTQSTAGH